jgi:two-component system chemotaxis response regulator CheY
MAKILIVDDSSMSRKKLRKILESGKHIVIDEGKDGLEGLDKYKALSPDIVTLDITMPNMNGLECLKGILDADEDARVVMISALGKGDTILEALKAGALNYITKPFDEKVILEVMEEALED